MEQYLNLPGLKVADNFIARLKGWMLKVPGPGDALLIRPCSSVHTFFMRVPIDVVFLDRDGKVVHIIENLKPWRLSPWVRGSCMVLEMPAGAVQRSGIKLGNLLVF